MGRAGRSFSDQRRKPEVLVPGKGIDFASDRQPDPFPGAPLSAGTIALEISSRNARVAALQKRWDRLRAGVDLVLDHRGADMADVPCGASGLLCRDYKGKEADRLVTRIDPGVVSLVAELRGHERQAAQELEQWKTHQADPRRSCKTGGFQGNKDRRFNDLQMFGPRFIRVLSGQEQEKKPTFSVPPSTSSVPPLHASSTTVWPGSGVRLPAIPLQAQCSNSDLLPHLALISDCALSRKSNGCNA
jgi:hypothetical protein